MLEGKLKDLYELLTKINETGSTVEAEIQGQEQRVAAEQGKLDALQRLGRMLNGPEPKAPAAPRKRRTRSDKGKPRSASAAEAACAEGQATVGA